MSNKFLGTTGAEIDVTNGSTVLYGSTIGAKSLKPSYAVKTNSAGNLISTKLFISDVENLQQKLNSVITNPYAGDLESKSFVSNNIYDTTRTSNISLSNDTINIVSESVKINGETVITAGTNIVQNPMTEDLNCNDNNLTNIGLLNGYDIGTMSSDIETLENKTFYIDGSSISPNGTIFSNYIYADKFIINGATTPAYLLSDGSTIAVSGQNSQSNIYLYHNSTVHVSPPNVGEVRFNNANNTLATTLWISHITHGANGVDIDVFLALITSVSIIYLQEADNSLNYIKYNVTTNPVIVENNYITLQVSQLSSGGSGASNFGNVDLIMSIFSNDTEIDGRITVVETKTQNIQATSSKLTVNRSLELKLDEPDFFAIRSIDGFVNYLIFDDTIMNLYTNLNLNANNLSNVGSIKISSFENSNFFIKTDGTIDENDYLQATDTVITDLQAKVQNQTAIPNATTLNGYTTVILREAEPDFFLVKGDGNDLKFTVGRTSLTCGENMNMSNKIITALGAPVSSSDAVRKAYVDDLITPLQTKTQNITATASENVFNNNSSFILRVANGDSFTIKNDDSPFSTAKFIVSNTSVQVASVPLLMNTQKITLVGEPTISTDAATKNYVDNAINLQGLSPYYRQAKGLTSVTTNGLNETIMNITPTFGSYTWADTAVGQTRHWKIQGAQTRSTFSATYTIRLKTNANTNITWILPATPAAVVNNQLFSIEITQTRQVSNALYYFLKFNSFDATAAGYSFFTSQNTGGNVAALNVSAPYTITIQSSIASSSLTVHSVDITAILN